MDNYISRLDEIDQWLFDSFGILPGACSSTENLRHTTARMVAEALWPKKDLALTWEDMKKIHHIAEHLKEYLDADIIVPFGANQEAFYTEVLRRFNEMKGVKVE